MCCIWTSFTRLVWIRITKHAGHVIHSNEHAVLSQQRYLVNIWILRAHIHNESSVHSSIRSHCWQICVGCACLPCYAIYRWPKVWAARWDEKQHQTFKRRHRTYTLWRSTARIVSFGRQWADCGWLISGFVHAWTKILTLLFPPPWFWCKRDDEVNIGVARSDMLTWIDQITNLRHEYRK